MKPSTTDRVLRILAQRPMTAGELGTELWDVTWDTDWCPHGMANAGVCGACKKTPNKRKGRIASSNGGGDYAAQMLLGRMRKAGLVRGTLPSADYQRGATVWVLTAKGKKEVEALEVVARFRKGVMFW